MTRTFFIVGPTATGKSDLAANVAREAGAEIISADAFSFMAGSICWNMMLFAASGTRGL